MLHGAAVQDSDRDGGVDGGYDLAALFLMDPPQPGAALTCSSGEWPGDVAVGGDFSVGGVAGDGDDGGGNDGGGGDGVGKASDGSTDVTASLTAAGAVTDIVSPLLSAPPSVAPDGRGSRGPPVETPGRVPLASHTPPTTSLKQCRVPSLLPTPPSVHPPDATVRPLPPPDVDASVAVPIVNNRAAAPPRPKSKPPQDEAGSAVERAAIRSAAGRARSLRTRRRNALRVSNMMQAIEYLEVANDRLRIAVTNAVAAVGSSREAGERARVVAGLRNSLASTTGVGVILFLRGLLSGLERQGS